MRKAKPGKIACMVAAIALLSPIVAQSATPAYEAALDRYYDLTYGQRLASADIDQLVGDFRDGLAAKPQAQSCPALKSALGEFAEHDFRAAVVAYFRSPTLRGQIKDVVRKHLTQADLEAFLAFADTPAGTSYVRNSAAVDAQVREALKTSKEKMLAAPEMKQLMSDMGAKLLPVMVQCQE